MSFNVPFQALKLRKKAVSYKKLKIIDDTHLPDLFKPKISNDSSSTKQICDQRRLLVK